MSFHFYLYRAPEGLGPVNGWSEMHAASLGTADQVKARLAALYPEITWSKAHDRWSGLGPNPVTGPYLDVLLNEEAPGKCFFVVLNKAAPSVMRRIMEAMQLNYVCAPEPGDLVDPYAYTDTDRNYAKKNR